MDEKEKEPVVETPMGGKKQGNLSISPAELVSLIDSMVTKSNEKLVEALIESRKPYVDPKTEENDKMLRANFKSLEERKRRGKALEQSSCPHLQGSNILSEESGDRTAVLWHRLDNGVWFGICTNCQREFWPEDKDYREWWTKKSGNRKSQAGQRDFLDQVQVEKDSAERRAARH